MNTDTDTRRVFNFYTHDNRGHYIIIPIRGLDEGDAFKTFDKLCINNDGSQNCVYQVIEAK